MPIVFYAPGHGAVCEDCLDTLPEGAAVFSEPADIGQRVGCWDEAKQCGHIDWPKGRK